MNKPTNPPKNPGNQQSQANRKKILNNQQVLTESQKN